MKETSKYNIAKNKKERTCNGITFDSAMEMRFYEEVVLSGLETGFITKCEMQKKFELQPAFTYKNQKFTAINYVADFVLTYIDGHTDIIDVKGYPDHVAPIKRKLLCYKNPEINFYWVTYSKIDGGWCSYEYLKKQRALRRKKRKKEKAEKEKKNGK